MSSNEFEGLPGTDLDQQIALVRLERRLQDQLDEAFTRIDQQALAQPLPVSEAPIEVNLGSQQIPRVSGLSLVPEPGVIIVQFNPVALDTLRFYEIQVSTDINFPGGETDSVFNTTDTQFTLAGFDPLTTFYVRVRAIAQTEVGGTLQGQFSTVLNTQTGQVNTDDLADGAVTSVKIGVAAIRSANIADAAIGRAQIGELAVGTANIQNLSVNGVKIVPGSVSNTSSFFNGGTVNVLGNRDTVVASVRLELPAGSNVVLLVMRLDTGSEIVGDQAQGISVILRRNGTGIAVSSVLPIQFGARFHNQTELDLVGGGIFTYTITVRPFGQRATVTNTKLSAIAIMK